MCQTQTSSLRADLHIHTHYSDSSRSIEEVFSLAKKKDLDLISVTDHDRYDHWPKIKEMSEKAGVACVIGVEISAMDRCTGKKVHVLGYGFRPEAGSIRSLVEETLEKRRKRSLEQMEILTAAGFAVDEERVRELSAYSGVIYKQHIMQMLIEKHIADDIYGSFYREYFKGEGICSKDIEYVDWRDAVEAVHQDGGLAVLAHPGESRLMGELSKYLSGGIDAIERNHPSHTVGDREFLDTWSIPTTGGSDDHGIYGTVGHVGEYLSAWIPVLNTFVRA